MRASETTGATAAESRVIRGSHGTAEAVPFHGIPGSIYETTSQFSVAVAGAFGFGMIVRAANLADVPVLMALQKDSPSTAQWTCTQYEEAFSDAAPERVVLIIENEQALGFVAARAVNDEWEIENIVIASIARRRGLAGRLFRELLKMAQQEKAAVFLLEVRESNRAARAFYEKLQFSEIGRRPRYYREPEEDAILYRRELK